MRRFAGKAMAMNESISIPKAKTKHSAKLFGKGWRSRSGSRRQSRQDWQAGWQPKIADQKSRQVIGWDDFADHILPGIGGKPGPKSLPDQHHKGQDNGGTVSRAADKRVRSAPGPRKGTRSWIVIHIDHRFIAGQPGDRTGHQQLRELKTHHVDRGNQANQDRRVGHRIHEQRE